MRGMHCENIRFEIFFKIKIKTVTLPFKNHYFFTWTFKNLLNNFVKYFLL